MKIYNIQGRLVRILVDEKHQSGDNKILWDGLVDKGETVTTGVYVYRIESGDEVKTRKMILMR